MAKFLLDSDAIIAMAKDDDANNKKAVVLKDKILGEKTLIASSTVLESVTVLRKIMGEFVAQKVLAGLLTSGYEIISIDESIILTAQKYFNKQKSRQETMFDCVNMAVAEVYNIDAIFSFDKGYLKNKFKLLK